MIEEATRDPAVGIGKPERLSRNLWRHAGRVRLAPRSQELEHGHRT